MLKGCSVGFPPHLKFIIDSSLDWPNEAGRYY